MKENEVSGEQQATIADLDVEVKSLDGVGQFLMTLAPGVTELWGGNAARKTRVRSAVDDVLGQRRQTSVSVTDGAEVLAGTARVGERTLRVSRSGSVRREGKVAVGVHLADSSAISDLIDPGMKDPEAQRKMQLRAFLTLLPLELTEERVRSILGEELHEDPIVGEILADLEAREITNLLEGTKRLKSIVQSKARESEKEATAAEAAINARMGAIDAILDGGEGEDFDVKVDVGALEQARREADVEAETLRSRRVDYVAAKERQEEARERIGDDLPTTDEAKDALAEIRLRIDGRGEALERVRKSLSEARARVEELQAEEIRVKDDIVELGADESRAVARVTEIEKAIEQQGELRKLVDEVITGPSEKEVDEAFDKANKADARVQHGRNAERYQEEKSKLDSAVDRHAEAEARGKLLRAIDGSAWTKLGDLVSQESPVEEITIHEGYLAYRTADGDLVDWNDKRVSTGQRNSAALRLGAACLGAGSILQIDGAVWELLEIEAKLEAHRLSRELDVFVLTEVASFSGDELDSVAVGSPEWVAQYQDLAEAAKEAVARRR